MKLYTGKGDQGKTGILGNERLSKDHARIEAYGTVDELNSVLGMLSHHCSDTIVKNIQTIQSALFEIGTELASSEPKPKLSEDDILQLEKWIDEATEQTSDLTSFILPGGSLGSSWLHLARTVCRRAERRVVSFQNQVETSANILVYLNRLSDLFFAWGRLENHLKGVEDVAWEARG